jgi:hypothetical protein
LLVTAAWLAAAVAYLLVHAGLYFVVLRRIPACVTERGVFLYHLVSAVCFSGAALVLWLLVPSSGASFAFAVGVIMMHGIYSLSFLEVWSLSEGGYSLQIMRAVVDSDRSGQPLDLTALEAIGSGKEAGRTESLARLGLIHQVDGQVWLTRRGQVAATLLAGLYSLVSVRAST